MAASFTKLFSSITESTVWGESHATRIVWITMLAMADRKGRIEASIPGLANRARVTLEEAEHALERFMAPDKYSRTPDNDGRRIEPMEGGWRLLNYEKYREMRDEEARREYMRDYMQDRRKQEKLTVSRSKPPLAQAEAEAERSKTLFDRFWKAYPRKEAKQDAIRAFAKLKLADGDFERVMQSLEAAKASSQWQRDGGKFVPHAATWLNGRRFEDEVAPQQERRVAI